MNTKIGLDELVPDQEKNSTPSKRYRLLNGTLKYFSGQEVTMLTDLPQGGKF